MFVRTRVRLSTRRPRTYRVRMWSCPSCDKNNDSGFDLCKYCGSDLDGRVDPLMRILARIRRGVRAFVILLPFIYPASYFLLSNHTSGPNYIWSGGTSREYTQHFRVFPFNPWIFEPVARIEYWIRGRASKVVIENGRNRDVRSSYSHGPWE